MARFTSRSSRATPGLIRRLVERGNGSLLATPPMQIVHGDVKVDLPARSLYTNNHCFGFRVATKTLLAHVNFRWKHLKAETLVVEQRNGIADDHVGQFANRLAYHLFAFRKRAAGKVARYAHGHFRSQIENHA